MFKLRKVALLLGGVVVCGVFGTGTASAVSPIYNWTGFYVGANAGVSGGQFHQTYAYSDSTFSYDAARATGFSGGVQAGVNFQPGAGSLVFGAEADFQGSTLMGTYADYGADLRFGTNVDWWGTARARIGLPLGGMLPFVTGGFAYGHVTSFINGPTYDPPVNTAWSTFSPGWTVGGGVEDALKQNLTVKLEYLYVDLGSAAHDDPQVDAVFPAIITTKVSFSTLRVGLNWKLN